MMSPQSQRARTGAQTSKRSAIAWSLLALLGITTALHAQPTTDPFAPASNPQTPVVAPAPGNAPGTAPGATVPSAQAQPGEFSTTTTETARLPYAVGRRIFPGDSGTGALVIEKHTPIEVRPGQPFSYKLVVVNPTGEVLRKVTMTEAPQPGYTIRAAQPQGRSGANGAVVWDLGDMQPRTSREVNVTAVADKVEKVSSCVYVTHEVAGCWSIRVTEPLLKLVQVLPEAASACDPIPVKLVVSNPGTGTAENVQVSYPLPQGLTTLDGKNVVAFNAGNLKPGEAKEFELKLKAASAGEYATAPTAAASGGLTAKTDGKFRVTQPKLAIKKEGPSKSLLERRINYSVTVTNEGDGPAREVIIKDRLQAGLKVNSASDNAKYNPQTGEVVWLIGDLPAKQARTVRLAVTPDKVGKITNTAVAEAYCVTPVTAAVDTVVSGVPAILLEVIDLNDPVELGTDCTYIITVTNQGTSTGTNIKIIALLENTQQYLSAEGATPTVTTGQRIEFAPLPNLPPKARAAWKVVVKAVGAGDVRFGVQMTSDQISRPVAETEATNFYQ